MSTAGYSIATGTSTWDRIKKWVPILVIAPSIVASFVYVFVFAGWTFYISLSDSTLLPTYGFKGFENYVSLWSNRRWGVAYTNLFYLLRLLRHLRDGLRAPARDPHRPEDPRRVVLADDLPLPACGQLHRHRHRVAVALQPRSGIQFMVNSLGWTDFKFALTTDRKYAIWAIIITGIWGSAGFSMALFLAGLRSVDPDIIKAAQIDGASWFRTYRKVILPTIAPIFLAVAVVLLQFAIKTFDLAVALTNSGPASRRRSPRPTSTTSCSSAARSAKARRQR